jgi:hypothetical protein
VYDIVLHIPHKAVAAQDIQRKSGQPIDPPVFGETPMRPVMHDIKADGRYHPAEQNAFHDAPEGIRCEKDQMDIDKDKGDHQDHRLQKKTVVTRFRLANFLKIIADSFFQFSMEGLRAGRELWQRHGQ